MLRIFAFLFILSVAFQNCRLQPISEPLSSKPGPVEPDGKESYTLEGNGDIYDGKTEYGTVDLDGQCGNGSHYKDLILVEKGKLFLSMENCKEIRPHKPLAKSDIDVAPHDADVIFYKGKAFVDGQYIDSMQAKNTISFVFCKKTEWDETKTALNVVHSYWNTGIDEDGLPFYHGHTTLGKYRKAAESGNTYTTEGEPRLFAEDDLSPMPENDEMADYLPDDPDMAVSGLFAYGGDFPNPNTYMLKLMATGPDANYTKAHLAVMDGPTEYKFMDLSCYSF